MEQIVREENGICFINNFKQYENLEKDKLQLYLTIQKIIR